MSFLGIVLGVIIFLLALSPYFQKSPLLVHIKVIYNKHENIFKRTVLFLNFGNRL